MAISRRCPIFGTGISLLISDPPKEKDPYLADPAGLLHRIRNDHFHPFEGAFSKFGVFPRGNSISVTWKNPALGIFANMVILTVLDCISDLERQAYPVLLPAHGS